MNTLFTHVASLLRNATGRVVLGAALAGTGLVSTAQAHYDGLDLKVDVRHGRAELEHRHWVEGRFEVRPTNIWVEPVYNTVPGARVFVEPVYRTAVDRVWREPVVREDQCQVLVPACFEERDVVHGRRVCRERVLIPAHYITKCRTVVVAPGHFEDVSRQELVCDGHWQCTPDQQVLVTVGHFELRPQRICITEGHWEERPVVVVR